MTKVQEYAYANTLFGKATCVEPKYNANTGNHCDKVPPMSEEYLTLAYITHDYANITRVN